MSNVEKRRLKFLLVEDDDAHVKIITRAFNKLGICSDCARVHDGEEALDFMYQRNQFSGEKLPDVILLDLNLPKISGIEVLRTLKGDEKLSHISVVVLTTSEAEKDKLDAYEFHVNSYLVKPAGPEAFNKMVEDLNVYWGQWNQPAK